MFSNFDLKILFDHAFNRGVAEIIPSPNGDLIHAPVCKIGEHWFSFLEEGDEELTPDDLKESPSKLTVLNAISEAFCELDITEQLYYVSYIIEYFACHNITLPELSATVRIQYFDEKNQEIITRLNQSILIRNKNDFSHFVNCISGINSEFYCFVANDVKRTLIPSCNIIPYDKENCDIVISPNVTAVKTKNGWLISRTNLYGQEYPGFDIEYHPDTQNFEDSVAIFSLSEHDAFNYDFVLVKDYVTNTVAESAYMDNKGDMVFCDGSVSDAFTFYSEYCEKEGLTLIPYGDFVRRAEEINVPPSVLFEESYDGELSVKIWNDPHNEDYTDKIVFIEKNTKKPFDELTLKEYKKVCREYVTAYWSDLENGTTEPSESDIEDAAELVSVDIIRKFYEED